MGDPKKPWATRRFAVSPVGVPNRNGRIYPHELWERVIAERQPDIDARRMLVGIYDDGKISFGPDHVGGIITRMAIEDDQLMIDVELLETNLGRVLALHTNLFEVTPMGSGHVGENGVIKDDYKLAGFTVSARPKEESK